MISGPGGLEGVLTFLGHSQTTCFSEAGDWDIFPQGIFLDNPRWLRQLSWLLAGHPHHCELLTLSKFAFYL